VLTHYLRWAVFNVLFAFIPLAAAVAVYFRVNNSLSWSAVTSSSHELLFIGLTVAATTLGDLIDVIRVTKRIGIYTIILVLLVFLVAAQAMLYGIEVSAASAILNRPTASDGLFPVAFWTAICTLILCLYVQHDIGGLKGLHAEKVGQNHAS
jgi:hypothetical protein